MTAHLTSATFTDDESAQIRAQLPAVAEIAYLNAGTLGPLPRAAIDAMAAERAYDEYRRQSPDLWERLTNAQARARDAVAVLTGVAASNVSLMQATHPGINACLWGMDLAAGDTLVTTDEEHPGLLVPLRNVSMRVGCEVRIAAWQDDDDAFVEGVLACVDARTRAVLLSHVSWVSGRVAPLRALRDALPPHVRIIVDGAQSAGTLETSPERDGWDAYTVSGQKWPCGPNGSGGLALADPTAWQPTYGAFMQVTDHEDILRSPLVDDGRRLEFAQEAMIPLTGLAAATDWLVGSVGLARVHTHARALNQRARTQLVHAGIEPAHLHGHNHLLVITSPGARAVAVATELYERGMLVRYLDPTRLRVSFGCWNTTSEVDAMADAVGNLLA